MYARVIVDVAPDHLDRPFDYEIPAETEVVVGQRVRVVFAGRRRDGWVVETAAEPAPDAKRVRPLAGIHAHEFDAGDFPFLRWVARRYAAPLAAVLRHAVPDRSAAAERAAAGWPPAAPVLPAERPPCPSDAWRDYDGSALLNACWRGEAGAFYLRPLPGADRAALVADLVARVLAAGRGAVVLAPDPASEVPGAALAQDPGGVDYRDERARYAGFLRGRAGLARVAVGERAAVFAPAPALGLIVVEDEANSAFKERRSPRHHAREVALARAYFAGAVCVLLGDVPSARAWRLREDGHVRVVQPVRAVERDRAPVVHVADLSDPRPGTRRTRLHERTTRAIGEALGRGGAAVVLTGRRGEGSALACRGCGLRRPCPVCAGPVGPVADSPEPPAVPDGAAAPAVARWQCAICDWTGGAFPCPACDQHDVAPLAAGAGRMAAELQRANPDAEVVRMEGFDAPGPTRRPAVAVMTRGSVVRRPRWLAGVTADVLAIPDADRFLARPTVDAAEDSLRLWFEASQWARRVVVQTREPGHPAVQALVRWDPDGFWRREAPRRAELGYPPAQHLVALRAPVATAGDIAAELRAALPDGDQVLGPDPEGAMLVKSAALWPTLERLAPLRAVWARDDRKVRIDVDPDPIR